MKLDNGTKQLDLTQRHSIFLKRIKRLTIMPVA
jgi:hypothetical protein